MFCQKMLALASCLRHVYNNTNEDYIYLCDLIHLHLLISNTCILFCLFNVIERTQSDHS